MKPLAKIIITVSLLVMTLGLQAAYAQSFIPKPKSLSGPDIAQQESLKGQGGVNGGYGVTFVIPFLTTFFVGFTGSMALVSFVYGGVLYVVSFGEEGQTEKAKKIMKWAAVGIAVAMLSYAFVSILLKLKIGAQ